MIESKQPIKCPMKVIDPRTLNKEEKEKLEYFENKKKVKHEEFNR
jgi:hypothetical protein